jgi:hypothetical protein
MKYSQYDQFKSLIDSDVMDKFCQEFKSELPILSMDTTETDKEFVYRHLVSYLLLQIGKFFCDKCGHLQWISSPNNHRWKCLQCGYEGAYQPFFEVQINELNQAVQKQIFETETYKKMLEKAANLYEKIIVKLEHSGFEIKGPHEVLGALTTILKERHEALDMLLKYKEKYGPFSDR